jgi:S-adenosylmethionine decarboxylase
MSINDAGTASYGTHLLLLLSGVEKAAALDSPVGLCDFLVDLVGKIGMRVLDGPRAVTESTDEDKYGHSAVIILYESHAAVHTYPARRSLFLDVFSCKPFDDGEVVDACHHVFGGFDVAERLVLNRGAHWNAPAETSVRAWATTRGNISLRK